MLNSVQGQMHCKSNAVLESADAIWLTTPSAKFYTKIPAGIDIKNTVKALHAIIISNMITEHTILLH